MDAHKLSIKVAALFPDRAEPVEWTEATTPEAIRRLARKLRREAPGEVRACYEAGPTGYGLQRLLESAGVICEMIAPSLTPVRPGSRIKTDRRDARKLAELLRAGLLTEVHPPSQANRRQLHARGAAVGRAAGATRRPARGVRRPGSVSRAGRLAALLQGHRHRHRRVPGRRAPRLPPLPLGAR